MMAIAAAAIRYLGVTGIVALAIVLFYEGVPLGPVRYVPFIGPALAGFVDGRVDREYARGRDDVAAEARAAALKAIQDRGEDNAEISKLDEMHLCQELGGRWIDTEARCD